jgi:hypothetical protein
MKMTHVSPIAATLALAFLTLVQSVVPSIARDASQTVQGAPAKASGDDRPDIVTAVKAAAAKDCGCKACAAKGCEPCHGKNCYFCAAKALVAMECGCGMCDAKGCEVCGPGCDVCKFHLAPVAEAEAPAQKQKK